MELKVNNYKELTKNINFSKQTKAIQEVHKKWESFVKYYKKNDWITRMIDNHLKAVEKVLNKTKKVNGKQGGNKPKSPKGIKAKPKPTKKPKKKATNRNLNKVPQIPLAVKFINSYLRLHKNTVTERQVVLLFQKIQKAAAEKRIRKSGKFAGEVTQIGNDLAETYREMGKSCKFVIPEPLYSKLKTISESFKVSPVTNYIKRFINLYDDITITKAKRLLTNIKNAKKKKKVSSRNSGYDKLNEIQKILENFIHSDKLQVTTVQLKGLKGLKGLAGMEK